jgi:perosamine synthetase
MAGPQVTKEDIAIVNDALKNGWYGEKKYYYCEKFEDEFAKYHDRKFGIMTPNCTTAIHLLLTALGIKEWDEVIIPECTWIASIAGAVYLKAKPIFCDVEKHNWCLDPEVVEKRITPQTKVIIAVNIYGNMCDMDSLRKISERYNIPLIEDAAESLGSVYKGIRSGKFGIGSVFSFHRTKTITTGEGGMLLLDDKNLYDRCMFLRDHGRKPGEYFNTEVTYKYMPFNLQAALGYAQFKRIDELIKIKRDQFHFYRDSLKDIDGLSFNYETKDIINGAWITGVLFDEGFGLTKDEIISSLKEVGVPARPFFWPLSSLPAFNEFNAYSHLNTVAYDICNRGINLPGALNLTIDQMKFVVEGIRKILC